MKTCVASPASTGWNVGKTLAYTAVVIAVLVLLVPYLISLVENRWGVTDFSSDLLFVSGAVLLSLGAVLYVASALTLAIWGSGSPWYFDCPRALVMRGPYRYVRNPMSVGLLLQMLGIALALGSPLGVLYALLVSIVDDFVMRPREQADLKERFGDAYETYRRRVRCWRPRLIAYDLSREAKEAPLAAEFTTPPGRHVVLYDGHCRFCEISAKRLLNLADSKKIDLVSFQDPGVLDRFPGISYDACMRQMFLVTPGGRVFGGFEAAVRAVATRPVLGAFAYIYYLPGLRWLLDSVYGLIAGIRYRILGKKVAQGECEGGTCAVHFGGGKQEVQEEEPVDSTP